jgi:hypothetical protein
VRTCMHPQDDPGGALDALTLSAVAAKLRVLDVSGCLYLHSIDVVRSCVQLRCLWMPFCVSVSDLSPLAACSETLEELWMAGCTSVKSLAPLKACTRLCKLDLRRCFELRDQVQDLRQSCTQLADPASVKIEGLVHELQPGIPPGMQGGAAYALYNMIQVGGHEAKDAIAAAAGTIPALVQLLASDSPAVPGNVAWALVSLARGHPQSQAAIADAGAIPALVQLLRPGPARDILVHHAAASALSSLAAEHTPNQSAIAAAGAVPLLVQLQGSTDARVRDTATRALLHLAAFRA